MRGHGVKLPPQHPTPPHSITNVVRNSLKELQRLHQQYCAQHGHPHPKVTVVLVCEAKFAVLLKPNERIDLMQVLTVGHADTLTILYLDQNGNPMKTPVTPDADPAVKWTNSPSDPSVDTFTVAPDGSQAVVQALAAGTDGVSVEVSVAGTVYSASDSIQISEAPQALTSVTIAHSVV